MPTTAGLTFLAAWTTAVFLELVHGSVISAARRKKGIVDLEAAEDADSDEDDGSSCRDDMFALHHSS